MNVVSLTGVARLAGIALLAMTMAACSGNPETGAGPRENTGTLAGAVAGGLIGSQFGGGTGERVPHAGGAGLRVRAHVTGVVQGVGFRPFVLGLAEELGVPAREIGVVGGDVLEIATGGETLRLDVRHLRTVWREALPRALDM